MIERSKYTFHIAKSEDRRRYNPIGMYAACLVLPDGQTEEVDSSPSQPILILHLDTILAAVIAVVPKLPSHSHLDIVIEEEHHRGRVEGPRPYPGTFNTTPHERETAGYLTKGDKDGLANPTQLIELDRLLNERGITTNGMKPHSVEQRRLRALLRNRAKHLLNSARGLSGTLEASLNPGCERDVRKRFIQHSA